MLIIASVGLNVTKDRLKKIILSGADVLRFNLSYRSLDKKIEYLKSAQETADSLNASVKTMVDFPISKIRLGNFDSQIHPVKENDELVFKSGVSSPDCGQFIPVNTPSLGKIVFEGQMISLGDGQVSIQVTEILDDETFKAKSLNSGGIHYSKSFNAGARINDEEMLKNYLGIMERIEPVSPDFIAFSYIPGIYRQLKEAPLTKSFKQNTRIVLKLETDIPDPELLDLCKDPFADMLLIDRGELGVNMPYEKVGVLQKKIIEMARARNKQTIVSTQILEGSMNNYIPMRSDLLDLTNLVLDGCHGIMFCNETGISPRPAYIISTAKKIIAEAEKYKNQTRAAA